MILQQKHAHNVLQLSAILNVDLQFSVVLVIFVRKVYQSTISHNMVKQHLSENEVKHIHVSLTKPS